MPCPAADSSLLSLSSCLSGAGGGGLAGSSTGLLRVGSDVMSDVEGGQYQPVEPVTPTGRRQPFLFPRIVLLDQVLAMAR